jgi:hypothetical protein
VPASHCVGDQILQFAVERKLHMAHVSRKDRLPGRVWSSLCDAE